MSPRNKIWLWSMSLALTGCNVGQGVKTLGKNVVGNGTKTSTSDTDAFAISLAYRDGSTDSTTPIRLVAIQGVRGNSAANLSTACGSTGGNCNCIFYRFSTDPTPVTTGIAGISQQNNSISCNIPTGSGSSGFSAADFTNFGSKMLVQVKRLDDATKSTGLISLTTTLSLTDILGNNLVKTSVRGIFRYSCNRTFFEGEGVSASNITCVSGQHLGVISASYNFYTYRSSVDSNSSGGDSPFPGDVCKRNNFLKIQCTGNTPVLRYGFYKDPADPFLVPVQMTRAPEGDNLSSTYGYAALPDSAGNCPIGLVKIRKWLAQPASIVQGSLGEPYPTSFINTNNTLNDTVVESDQPANFIVNRQPNVAACSSDPATSGDCTNAGFGGAVQVQSVAYSGQTPIVCAIPAGLLSGLF